MVLVIVWTFWLSGTAWCGTLQQNPPASTVKVTKVEPPNWWVGFTPGVMLLLAGQDLEATQVSCNLPTLRVSRTQATAGGKYLFVWLTIGGDTRPGTAVCRISATGHDLVRIAAGRAHADARQVSGVVAG